MSSKSSYFALFCPVFALFCLLFVLFCQKYRQILMLKKVWAGKRRAGSRKLSKRQALAQRRATEKRSRESTRLQNMIPRDTDDYDSSEYGSGDDRRKSTRRKLGINQNKEQLVGRPVGAEITTELEVEEQLLAPPPDCLSILQRSIGNFLLLLCQILILITQVPLSE
jgi:hypothetical protein